MDEDARAFSDQLRQQARRNRLTVNAEPESPILIAMREHDAAVKTGSETAITAARQKVETLIEAQAPASWREAAGTRPGRQEPVSMTELLRRARYHAA